MSNFKDYCQLEECPHNQGVACSVYHRFKCSKCGWNPKVIEERMKQLQKGQVLQNERV